MFFEFSLFDEPGFNVWTFFSIDPTLIWSSIGLSLKFQILVPCPETRVWSWHPLKHFITETKLRQCISPVGRFKWKKLLMIHEKDTSVSRPDDESLVYSAFSLSKDMKWHSMINSLMMQNLYKTTSSSVSKDHYKQLMHCHVAQRLESIILKTLNYGRDPKLPCWIVTEQ